MESDAYVSLKVSGEKGPYMFKDAFLPNSLQILVAL